MSSFLQVVPESDADSGQAAARMVNPWMAALGVLAGLLLLGGVVTVAVGLSITGTWDDTVLGQNQGYDGGVATAIVGGAAIVLAVLVGACWLVLGAVALNRRS